MKDYYSILDISGEASAQEIKKAYFYKVRKYPPDRYPDEFMKIREAYEVLTDSNTRKQYDIMDLMPDIVKSFYDSAKEALEAGESGRAVGLLENVTGVYRDFYIVNSLLGDAYLENDNSGKALQVFEELVAKEPGNASFAAKLADAYLRRGWHKKAMDKYRSAILLDEDNISLWIGLIKCHMRAGDFEETKKIALEGISVGKRKGWESLELYYRIIMADIRSADNDELYRDLEKMKEFAVRNEDQKGNVAWFLATLAKDLQNYEIFEASAAAINAAFELLPGDPEIQRMHAEIQKDGVRLTQLEKLKSDISFSVFFSHMFEFELHKCGEKDCFDCEYEGFAFEMDMLVNIDSLRREIIRLKSKYPELYSIKGDFFAKALDVKRFANLMDNYQIRLNRFVRMFPGKFDEEDFEPDLLPQQPARRNENKVGRNDQCPCGSGKKYKKCCGQ